MKNPSMTIASEAVVKYLTEDIPFDETIRACTDPRRFVTVIKVTDGATWRNHPLGRAVRFYWSINGDPILAKGNRRVPKTEGARPLPEMAETLPNDIDWLRYSLEAERLTADLGIYFN